MDNLKDLLLNFKEETNKIIESLKKENFDEVNERLDNRDKIIKKIEKLKKDKEEFTEIALSIDIKPLDDMLNAILKEKLEKSKVALMEIKEGKNALKSYENISSPDSIFIRKKI